MKRAMNHAQNIVFQWVAQQPLGTGLVVAMLGFMYAFWGVKFFPGLLALACAGVGWLCGMIISGFLDVPLYLAAALGTLAVGAIGIFSRKTGTVLACAAGGALFTLYLGDQLNADGIVMIVLGVAGVGFGSAFALMCPRTMPVLLTTGMGTALLFIGFVGTMTRLMPDIGGTFRDWAASMSLFVPILGIMVFVAGYSYQTMLQRGDMVTGM